MKIRFLFFTTLIVLGVGCFISACQSDSSKLVSLGELDSLNLVDLDSVSLKLTKADLRNSLLTVVFNPWCDHCQAEAEEIYNNMNKLTEVTIVMIGSVPMTGIKDFSVKYGLNNFGNVIFAYASPVVLYDKFGAVPMPYLRLYNKDIKFIKDFKSTTPVNEILSHVQ